MNDDQKFTLNAFFSFGKESPEGKLAGAESSEKITSVKEKVLKSAGGNWPLASKNIEEKIGDLLNVGIPDILLGAWKKYQGVRKYLDREKYPPDESYLVSMGEHTVKSEHHPYIEIIINETFKSRLDFEISLSLDLEGIILKIQDGKILEILTGSCKGKGIVKCENFVILEKESGSFPLPGSIKLGDGVPIR
ncbi:MAG: hypothetical protein NTU98_14965 [Bacteroidetes bacterium]|nr:hypothetical protein [Bacteroidota bacterium]